MDKLTTRALTLKIHYQGSCGTSPDTSDPRILSLSNWMMFHRLDRFYQCCAHLIHQPSTRIFVCRVLYLTERYVVLSYSMKAPSLSNLEALEFGTDLGGWISDCMCHFSPWKRMCIHTHRASPWAQQMKLQKMTGDLS